MDHRPTVFVVDDDRNDRDLIQWLGQSAGLRIESFGSPTAFLESYDPARPGCVVVDLRMPEMSGLDLFEAIQAHGQGPPIVVLTGHGDIDTCSRALKAGAFDFLEKTAGDQRKLDVIQGAIAHDARARESRNQQTDLGDRLESLSPREREVMDDLVAGKTMKEIAADYSISIQTVSKHRAKVLNKLGVLNDVELTRLFLTGEIRPSQ
jgi:RNA polymerase sigma factor (sigma-70 family)